MMTTTKTITGCVDAISSGLQTLQGLLAEPTAEHFKDHRQAFDEFERRMAEARTISLAMAHSAMAAQASRLVKSTDPEDFFTQHQGKSREEARSLMKEATARYGPIDGTEVEDNDEAQQRWEREQQEADDRVRLRAQQREEKLRRRRQRDQEKRLAREKNDIIDACLRDVDAGDVARLKQLREDAEEAATKRTAEELRGWLTERVQEVNAVAGDSPLQGRNPEFWLGDIDDARGCEFGGYAGPDLAASLHAEFGSEQLGGTSGEGHGQRELSRRRCDALQAMIVRGAKATKGRGKHQRSASRNTAASSASSASSAATAGMGEKGTTHIATGTSRSVYLPPLLGNPKFGFVKSQVGRLLDRHITPRQASEQLIAYLRCLAAGEGARAGISQIQRLRATIPNGEATLDELALARAYRLASQGSSAGNRPAGSRVFDDSVRPPKTTQPSQSANGTARKAG